MGCFYDLWNHNADYQNCTFDDTIHLRCDEDHWQEILVDLDLNIVQFTERYGPR